MIVVMLYLVNSSKHSKQMYIFIINNCWYCRWNSTSCSKTKLYCIDIWMVIICQLML